MDQSDFGGGGSFNHILLLKLLELPKNLPVSLRVEVDIERVSDSFRERSVLEELLLLVLRNPYSYCRYVLQSVGQNVLSLL